VGNLRIHLAWAVVTLGAAGAWGRWCTPPAGPARPAREAGSEISAPTSPPPPTAEADSTKPTVAAAPSVVPPAAPVFPAYTYEVLTVEQIRALIRSDTKKDGYRAIRAINKLVDKTLQRELFRELVPCKDEYVRSASLTASEDRPLLRNALKNDPSDWVRRNAALVLGKIGGEGAIEALLEATRDADIYVRVNAAQALVQFGRPEAAAELVRSLEPSLTSPDDAVRHDAVDNLAELRIPAAIPALVRALRDGNGGIRDLGYRGLEALDTPELLPVLESLRQDPDARVAQAAKDLLEQRARK